MQNQPLKWHGGKSYSAPWLHSLAPASVLEDSQHGYTHRNIVCFGGGAEFWNWHPVEGISEAINDVDPDLINFYTVLASKELSAELIRILRVTNFSEFWWQESEGYHVLPEASEPSIACAAKFFIRYRQSRQGLAKDFATPTTRIRRGMNENVSAWLTAVDCLAECVQRLNRVEIRNMDFAGFIAKYDHPRAFFYLDPPYTEDSRITVGEYRYEMSLERHQELLDLLTAIEGKFMLSSYHNPTYDAWAIVNGYSCHEREFDAKASSQKVKPKRVECVWTNYN